MNVDKVKLLLAFGILIVFAISLVAIYVWLFTVNTTLAVMLLVFGGIYAIFKAVTWAYRTISDWRDEL